MTLWKKILIAMVSIIFFISLMIGVSAFDLTGTVVHDFESEIVELTADNTVGQMLDLFSGARDIITRMVEETGTHAIAARTGLSAAERAEYERALRGDLIDFLELSQMTGADTFHFINMYLKNGVKAITAGEGVLPYNDFDEVCDYLSRDRFLSADEYRNIMWYDVVQLSNSQGIRVDCFLCVRFLYDRVTMERIGAIVAGVDTDKLWNMYKTIFPEAMIVTTWGDVVVSGKSLAPGQDLPASLAQAVTQAEGPKSRISYAMQEEPQQALCWKVANGYACFVVPLQETGLFESNAIRQFFFHISIVIGAAILVTSLAAIVFSKSVTNGLRKLENVVGRIAEGERNVRFKPKKHDEVAYVGLQFNYMLDQLEKYYTDLQLSEKEKTDLELSLLNAKINPHLLYNTLDIVAWAIKNDDRQRAEQIVYALSDFFKRSLAKGREYTTLEECVALIRSYLELQRLAGGKDYRLQVDVDPQLAEYKLLHLLLQPIVENSVKHGFSAFRDDGTICITARLTDGLVELHVRDDGVGIAPDQAAAINRALSEELHVENRRHYGLRNVARRIKVYYGKEYGMEISSEAGEYTDVTIRIPYTKGLGDEECSN